MTFLNPAILFGLIATAIPVLLHLLNLRKLKKVEFSTLSFLKEMQKNKIRKIKFKQWLLLALRILIIIFIVTSFARPTIKGFAIGGTTSSAKTTAIFVLDNTISMSVVDEKGSYFNSAKQTIKNLINEFQEGDALYLLTSENINDDEINPVSNISEFIKQVDAVELSDASFAINSAITKAAQLLDNSENFNKEIYLLSDFQKSRLTNPGEQVSNLGEILNENVKLYKFDFSGKTIFNLGIDSIKIQNQIFEKNKPINFTAFVKNYGEQPVNNFIASLFINGERSAQQSINIKNGEAIPVDFETVLRNEGLIEISIELEDDDILQDNGKYLSFYIPEKISVGLFTTNISGQNFIELAITAASKENIEITKRELSRISGTELSNFDVLIIEGETNQQNFKNYILSGGGALIIPSENSQLNDFNQMIKDLSIPQAQNIISGNENNAAVFDIVDFQHPIFLNLFEENSKKQIESPEIYKYFKIPTQGIGKSIISLIDRSSFFSEYKSGSGKILLINSAINFDWNNFALKAIFAPLITKSVYYLSSKENRVKDFIAGENAIVNSGNSNLPQVKIVKPNGIEEIAEVQGRSGFLNYENSNIAGNYKVFSGETLTDYFSVNVNPLESDVQKLSRSDFENYLQQVNFKGNLIELNADENFSEEIRQARFGSELWRLFLIIALILALLEMIISRSAKKDLATNLN